MINKDSSAYLSSLQSLQQWLERTGYKAYDPFDGLSSFLRPLTLRRKFPQQVLQQFVRRNPFNLRPLLGIKPHTSTKGMGFLASGYLKLYQYSGDDQYLAKARTCYTWLTDNYSRGYSGFCWGNGFDYISRASYLPAGAPTMVWSALIGHHFIEGYRLLRDDSYLAVARSVGEFIMKDLPRIPQEQGVCLGYVVDRPFAVHNANLLGARLLAELFRETGGRQYRDLAHQALVYSATAQLPNGAWYYGEHPMHHWIDSWHTAYNLDGVLDYGLNTGSTEFEQVYLKGLQFYHDHFFNPDGAPRYYWDRDYKYDIQSASQAIDTLVTAGSVLRRPGLIATAGRVARWAIDNMQDPTGYFYLWKNKWWTNRTPTFHWGGTTMFHALAHLLLEMKNAEAHHAREAL